MIQGNILIKCVNKNITDFEVPSNIKMIIEGAFKDCHCLCKIYINENLLFIGNEAFQKCKSISNIIKPNSVEKISPGAFFGCDGLTIIAEENSYAHQYAMDKNINFVNIEIFNLLKEV